MQRSEEFTRLVISATDYLREQQDKLASEFSLWKWPRYDWSQDTRQLVFSDQGQPRVVADVQFVGSLSTRSNSWLWAWANDSVDGSLTVAASAVRQYGDRHGMEPLTTGLWHAHEADGWEMTSVTALLNSCRGAYRTPKESGFTYMVLSEVRWAT